MATSTRVGKEDRLIAPAAMLSWPTDTPRRRHSDCRGLARVVPYLPVPYYLYAHAIELAMKSFLCGAE